MIDALLLGTGGTIPLPDRPLSALLVRIGPEMMLFDCGEGTQVSMRRWGWGFKALSAICLSHMHADHVAGLPGLLLSMGKSARSEPVQIFGPLGTRRVVEGLRVVAPRLPFEVQVHELGDGAEAPWNEARLTVQQLEHGVTCLGYRLDLPRSRRFDPARAQALGAPVETWKALQHGQEVEVGRRVIHPDAVLGPSRRGLSLAYVTDSRPTPGLPSFVSGADLLVCEGTYGDDADAANAVENGHMLFSEAAAIAHAASARRLWLTHFSAKMLDPERYVENARRLFGPTTIGHGGLSVTLRFEDEGEMPSQSDGIS